MCGIVGFVGKESAAPVVLQALRNLEYRGYDSAGLACICDGKILAKKDAGKLAEVNEKHYLDGLPGSIAIGHVRWATHGSVTSTNAHPHLDCKGRVAVVHNGIIENYQQLRHLLGVDHVFLSETDSEVIPHLIEYHLGSGIPLEEAVLAAVQQIKGSYAFLTVSADESGKIVATRKGSPLVIGMGEKGCFAASDALSLTNEVNKVVYLEDGDIAVLNCGEILFLDGEGKQITKEATTVSWKEEDFTKSDYDFFMLKEISEQPQALRRAVIQDKEAFIELAMDILRAKQVVITACGSSRYAALVGRYLFSQIAQKFCEVVMASEFHYFSDSLNKDTLVLAVSQSGETADVIEGVKRAKANGAPILSIVNRPDSTLVRASDDVISINCGPEIGVAATKSFLNQLAIFYLLAFSMVNQFDSVAQKLKEVSWNLEANLARNGNMIGALAERVKERDNFYYIARGINFAIASEGALKLKEISYIHAEGMPAGELKHGTLALIEEGVPVVVVCPRDYTFDETLSNTVEAKSRGAFVIGVSDEDNKVFDYWIEIPKVEEVFYPLVSVVPLQQLAYHIAVSRGKDPDRPRNLAKSVTVK